MSLTSRVLWQEGMFLRSQHFQQQDRWIEHLLVGLHRSLGPNHWGVHELSIDQGSLGRGQLSLARAAGIFPDGTMFAFPDHSDDAEMPAPLDFKDDARGVVVYLTLASPALGAVQVGDAASGRFRLSGAKLLAFDTQSTERPEEIPSAELEVGKLRLSLQRGDKDLAGLTRIAVARIEQVAPNRQITLDPDFIPPILSCRASQRLSSFLGELNGLMAATRERLLAMVGDGPVGSHAEKAHFQLLQAANRWLPLIQHWAETASVHPEPVYQAFAQIAGEWATFVRNNHRTIDLPPYRHDNLASSFGPIIKALRDDLPFTLAPGVVELPLREVPNAGPGAWRGDIPDPNLLNGAFFLVVRANRTSADLRKKFPELVKIGPLKSMGDLVTRQIRGIALASVAAPRDLPFAADASYFELDRGSPYFPMMQKSVGFGIHVSNVEQEFPSLQLQLWSVRR